MDVLSKIVTAPKGGIKEAGEALVYRQDLGVLDHEICKAGEALNQSKGLLAATMLVVMICIVGCGDAENTSMSELETNPDGDIALNGTWVNNSCSLDTYDYQTVSTSSEAGEGSDENEEPTIVSENRIYSTHQLKFSGTSIVRTTRYFNDNACREPNLSNPELAVDASFSLPEGRVETVMGTGYFIDIVGPLTVNGGVTEDIAQYTIYVVSGDRLYFGGYAQDGDAEADRLAGSSPEHRFTAIDVNQYFIKQ